MTHYIITGAAGHLGSTITRLLREQGQQIRGLILPSEQEDFPDVEYTRGNVLDLDSLRPLFQRKTGERLVVFHTAGLIDVTAEMSRPLYNVNVTGTKNVLKLCEEYQVDKLLYVSSVHAIPEAGVPTVQTEISEFSPDRVVGGYAKTKAEATQAVLDAAADGLPAVVVHPSGIIGPYDTGRNHLVQVLRDFMEGHLPVCVKGGYDLVDVRDAAQGCILAAEKGRVGECYLLSGEYHEIQEILALTASICGKRHPPVVPMPFVQAAEPILSRWAKFRGRRPLYTRYSLDTLCSPTRFSSQKARDDLGYTTRCFQETIRDTVQWLLEH